MRTPPVVPLIALAGLLGLGRTHATHAQAPGRGALPDSAMVPRELALALLGGFGPPGQGRPEIIVGQLPADFPRDAAPAGPVAVLGGVAYPDDGGLPRWSRSTAVVVVRQEPAAALAAYEAQLGRSGWRHPEEPATRGGFVPSVATRPATFCRDSTFLTAWTAPRAGGGSYLRIHFTRAARVNPCDPERTTPQRMWEDVPMPALQAPAGAASEGGGMRGGPDMSEAQTRLETPLGPAELVAHYAAQLRQAGWTLGAPFAGDGAAAQTAERRDAEGRSWYGLLIVIARPGTAEREVAFRVMHPRARRR